MQKTNGEIGKSKFPKQNSSKQKRPKFNFTKLEKYKGQNNGKGLNKTIGRKSIKVRLIFYVSMLVILSSTVLGFLALDIARETVIKEAKKTLATLANSSADIAEKTLENQRSSVEMFTKIKEINSMVWADQKFILKDVVMEKGFTELGVLYPDGKLYYTSGRTIDIHPEDPIMEIFEGSPFVITNTVNQDVGTQTLMQAVPINKYNEIVGAIVSESQGDILSTMAKGAGYGEQGYGYIIDGTGTVIGHPNYDYVLNKFSPIKEAISDKNMESLSHLIEAMIDSKEGVRDYTYEGNNLYAGFAPIEGTDWTFVTVATENELLESEVKLISNIVFASALVILIIIVITFFFGNSFTKPIILTAKSAEKIASLDISENIDKKYLSLNNEIGIMAKANQSIIDNLRNIIGEINNSSEQLAASSEELTAISGQTADAAQEVSKTIQDIAHGASDQARLTEGGSHKAATLGENITKVKEYISSVNESSDKVSDVVDTGLVEINSLYEITNESTSAIEEIARVIADTSLSSNKIGEASNVIETISAQTNLLSLNASIEAARAGEAGRGFAIVAGEIGKLAEQSKSSANTINEIVKELQDNIAIAVKSMERVTNISKEQAESVINSKDKYQLIADAMRLTSKAVDQLEASGDIMDNMKEEIMDVLQNLSAIAEENAASTQEASATAQEETAAVEEIANASEGLSELARGLQILVAKFKV